eukprot:gene6226-10232_t
MEKEQLTQEIEKYVKNCKDGNYSLKTVRTNIEKEYGINLLDKKDLIKEILMSTVNQTSEEHVETVAVVPKKETKKIKEAPKFELPQKTKKQKVESNSKFKTDEQGEPYFELPRNRRITISQFRGKWNVQIREYYDANGVMKPGKKGIALSMDEWNELKEVIPEVDELIERKM